MKHFMSRLQSKVKEKQLLNVLYQVIVKGL